jgi:hypothetical protein
MDIYDGADWTEMDIEDLKAAVEGPEQPPRERPGFSSKRRPT